jgi:hypothetical protein
MVLKDIFARKNWRKTLVIFAPKIGEKIGDFDSHYICIRQK